MSASFQAKDLLSVVALFAKAVQASDGPILSSSQIWAALGEAQDTSLVQDDSLTEMFRNPREYLRKYETMLSLFHGLTTSLAQVTRSLKEELDGVVRCRGIDSLPNEILLTIMEYAVSSFSDGFTLTRVCNRFRSLAFSSPKLWANCQLTLSTTEWEISSITDLSRGLPLTASMTSSFLHQDDLLAAERILNCRSVLEKLEITTFDGDVKHGLFNEIHLPLLCDLSIAHEVYGSARPVNHFYAKWEMPQLRHLKANFIPPQGFAGGIVSLKLELGTFSYFREIELNPTLEFLASCPCLESLHIRIIDILVDTDPEEGHAVKLGRLRSLTIEVSTPEYFQWTARFLERVVIENVSEFSLRVDKLRRLWDDVDVLAKRVSRESEIETWGPVVVARIAKIPHVRVMKLYLEENEKNTIEEDGSRRISKDEYFWGFISVIRELPPTVESFESISPLHYIDLRGRNTGSPTLRIRHGKRLSTEQLLTLIDWEGIGAGMIQLEDCPWIRPEDPRFDVPRVTTYGQI